MSLKKERYGDGGLGIRAMSLQDYEDYLYAIKDGKKFYHVGLAISRCLHDFISGNPIYDAPEDAMKNLEIEEATKIFRAIKKISGLEENKEEDDTDPNDQKGE